MARDSPRHRAIAHICAHWHAIGFWQGRSSWGYPTDLWVPWEYLGIRY
jgi:hypothetical protein